MAGRKALPLVELRELAYKYDEAAECANTQQLLDHNSALTEERPAECISHTVTELKTVRRPPAER